MSHDYWLVRLHSCVGRSRWCLHATPHLNGGNHWVFLPLILLARCPPTFAGLHANTERVCHSNLSYLIPLPHFYQPLPFVSAFTCGLSWKLSNSWSTVQIATVDSYDKKQSILLSSCDFSAGVPLQKQDDYIINLWNLDLCAITPPPPQKKRDSAFRKGDSHSRWLIFSMNATLSLSRADQLPSLLRTHQITLCTVSTVFHSCSALAFMCWHNVKQREPKWLFMT